jgi:hypothetical protein
MTTEISTNGFDPAQHIERLRNGDYLPVKWRLVWLRSIYPNALIDTEMVHLDPDKGMAVFKATVTIPEGGSATGYGSETAKDFGDWLEKAETKSIGRALAALGFGTQFAAEMSEGEVDRPVDSPVSRDNRAREIFNAPAPAAPAGDNLATEKQIKFIFKLGHDMSLSNERIVARCKELFGVEPDKLTRQNARTMIEKMQAALPKAETQPA